jgi:hypothetical protein
MKRVYLEEDMDLIRKYFPGAETVALRTPFDLTAHGHRLQRLSAKSLHNEDALHSGWEGGILWMS